MLKTKNWSGYNMNIIIGMGSNQDYTGKTPIKILNEAKDRMIKRGIIINHQSPYYQSPAFPDETKPEFTNCVVGVQFGGTPGQLLNEIKRIESQLGRHRSERWGQRTCDLDILGIGNLVLPNIQKFKYWASLDFNYQLITVPNELIIPHPRLQDRAFVLKPLFSIMPNWTHPVFLKTVAEMLEMLPEKAKKSVVESI